MAVAAFKDPVQDRLAEAGLAPPVDRVGRNHRTVQFLRSLELDPVDILGERVVIESDAWVRPAPFYPAWRSLLPIGSQRRLAVQ